jgi:hypothetical protein
MLVYGYHLGGGDSEWLINEVDEYGAPLPLAWLPDYDLPELAMDHLLAAAGFTETDYKAAGFFDRKQTAEDQVGVKFESHCSGDYPMWILAAKTYTASRGDADPLDLAELAQDPERNGWDEKLRHACEVLGITPKQERPCWLLCSYWG